MTKHSGVPNPFKHRRIWLGLTQDQLAEKSGLTRQTVTELEAGLVRKPPDTLCTALSSSETDRHRLLADYASWVAMKRRDNEYKFREDWNVVSFADFINAMGGSIRGFCMNLVIQRSIVRNYLSSGSDASWEIIENCLWHVGLSGDYTRWLHSLTKE